MSQFRLWGTQGDTIAIAITGYDYEVNIKDRVIATGWDQVTPVNVICTVAASAVIGAYNPTNPVIRTGGFPGTITGLKLHVLGRVYGAGGDGGRGAYLYSGVNQTDGEDGGDAILIEDPCEVEIGPAAFVWGGGGGGGGGLPSTSSAQYKIGGGGGGGAGLVPGIGGIGGTDSPAFNAVDGYGPSGLDVSPMHPDADWYSSGWPGNGGNGGSGQNFPSGSAGAGGVGGWAMRSSAGYNPGAGANGYNAGKAAGGGFGGGAGLMINGFSLITSYVAHPSSTSGQLSGAVSG